MATVHTARAGMVRTVGKDRMVTTPCGVGVNVKSERVTLDWNKVTCAECRRNG